MKKVFIYLLMVPAFIKAQTYTDFPKSNAAWKDYYWYVDGHGPGYTHYLVEDYAYTINGDTIVGKNNYQKIRRMGWKRSIGETQSNHTHDSTFSCGSIGCIRSDSLKHVFFLSKDSLNEHMIYDFNLNIGDTLPLLYGTHQYNVYIIKSIDSILISNKQRKRYNICTTKDSTTFVSLIEGIGSTWGLFNGYFAVPSEVLAVNFFGAALVAYYLNNNNVFSVALPKGSPTNPNLKIYDCAQ